MKRISFITLFLVILSLLFLASQVRADTTLELTEQNNSGISGTVTMVDKGNQTEVTITMNRQADGTKPMPAHIHNGRCNENPQVIYPLTAVVDTKSVTMVNAPLSEIESIVRSVQVHRSAEEIAQYVACADIQPMTQLPRTGESQNMFYAQVAVLLMLALLGMGFILRRSSV